MQLNIYIRITGDPRPKYIYHYMSFRREKETLEIKFKSVKKSFNDSLSKKAWLVHICQYAYHVLASIIINCYIYLSTHYIYSIIIMS